MVERIRSGASSTVTGAMRRVMSAESAAGAVGWLAAGPGSMTIWPGVWREAAAAMARGPSLRRSRRFTEISPGALDGTRLELGCCGSGPSWGTPLPPLDIKVLKTGHLGPDRLR